MKTLKVKVELCDGCGICELVCSKVQFKEVEEDREKSAIRVSEKTGGYEINVCNQCGECVEVCPTMALNKNKSGVIMTDKDKCVGCFACIGFCPTLSMRMHNDFLEPFKCIACGKCAKKCPTEALYIEKL